MIDLRALTQKAGGTSITHNDADPQAWFSLLGNDRIAEFARLVLEEAAAVAQSYEPRCDRCPSGVANAIRALKP